MPCETPLNAETARLDRHGRLWSPFLRDKFRLGSRIQLIKTKEGFQVETVTSAHENAALSTKCKSEKFSRSPTKTERTTQRRRGRKGGTETSSFGSPGRIGHDSSRFYNSKLYKNLPREKKVVYVEKEINKEFLNKIFCKSSENMDELPDSSVHLMVTSPPYNVGKEYDKDFTLDEYRNLLRRVFKEVYRVLVSGGRACVNIANLGRKPYIPLHSWIIQDMLDIGFLMRGEIIWNKGSSAAASTAWGSWRSASNPTLRDVHEYIMIFSKDTFSRLKLKTRESTITRDEFLEWTKSVWTFQAESATRVGHPAPFPVELPLRTIKLYTFEEEIVLDPFIGSGTTAIAALQANRHYIGYDTNKGYVKLAEKRIEDFISSQSQAKLAEFPHTHKS
ncbi:site-specific DNA-methyltransferase [Candidatus Bathyarchaeota archaeon]|nr:site-specific DNA-methyltransferase [Candidatus Bathyarchaeota archaeon]